MTTANRELSELLDLLQAKGVRFFKSPEFQFEFFAPVLKSQQEALPKPKICSCGHEEFEHSTHGCLRGCLECKDPAPEEPAP
jgi:hypothetical protein